jgi:putative hydrolase of the HAD superfamily
MTAPSRILAVVFDFGGVLITTIANQVGAVARTHELPTTTMLEILLGPHESGEHPWHLAERGELAVADIQGLLQPWADPHGITLRGGEIEALLSAGGYRTVPEMNAKVAQLKGAGLATGLLTNTFAEFRSTMERDLHFPDFTEVVESFAVGSRKPEPQIYEVMRERLGVDHREILYLDDFAQNIAMAQSFGWSTVHVSDPVADVARIDEFLSPTLRRSLSDRTTST